MPTSPLAVCRTDNHYRQNADRCAAQGCRCQKLHGPQAQKQEGIKDLSPEQSDRGAGERPDQGMPGSAAFSSKGAGEGEWRVAPDRCHAQPAEVIQLQAITAAGAGGGEGVRAATLANRARAG